MVTAAIAAGGSGHRMGTETPKQFLEIAGVPVIIRTISVFLENPLIDHIIVGIHPGWCEHLNGLIEIYIKDSSKISVIAGGADRNGTICNMVEKAAESFSLCDDDIFLTHDAARPFVESRIIAANIDAAGKYGVCTSAIAAADTILRCTEDGFVRDIPARREMYQCQTPQSFKYGLFKKVVSQLSEEELAAATDVSGLFLLMGYEVKIVEGSINNFKITYPEDLERAESLARKI